LVRLTLDARPEDAETLRTLAKRIRNAEPVDAGKMREALAALLAS